ncbi:CRISPR-associated DxTHG motif protein [Leucobacter sp. 7(1)]
MPVTRRERITHGIRSMPVWVSQKCRSRPATRC